MEKFRRELGKALEGSRIAAPGGQGLSHVGSDLASDGFSWLLALLVADFRLIEPSWHGHGRPGRALAGLAGRIRIKHREFHRRDDASSTRASRVGGRSSTVPGWLRPLGRVPSR